MSIERLEFSQLGKKVIRLRVDESWTQVILPSFGNARR